MTRSTIYLRRHRVPLWPMLIVRAAEKRLRQHWWEVVCLIYWTGATALVVSNETDPRFTMIFGGFAALSVRAILRKLAGKEKASEDSRVISTLIAGLIIDCLGQRKFVGPGVEISTRRDIKIRDRDIQIIVREAA